MTEMASIWGVALVILFGGDPLTMRDVNEYWHERGVLVSFERMNALLDNNEVQSDDAALVKKLHSGRFAERERATRLLLERGQSAAAALRMAARSRDPEISSRAKDILEKITGQAYDLENVDRLMAIRTLGELGNPAAVAILRPLLQSKDPLTSGCARDALARLEGAPATEHRVTREQLDEDLKTLPAECTIVGCMQVARKPLSLAAVFPPRSLLADNAAGRYHAQRMNNREQENMLRRRYERVSSRWHSTNPDEYVYGPFSHIEDESDSAAERGRSFLESFLMPLTGGFRIDSVTFGVKMVRDKKYSYSSPGAAENEKGNATEMGRSVGPAWAVVIFRGQYDREKIIRTMTALADTEDEEGEKIQMCQTTDIPGKKYPMYSIRTSSDPPMEIIPESNSRLIVMVPLAYYGCDESGTTANGTPGQKFIGRAIPVGNNPNPPLPKATADNVLIKALLKKQGAAFSDSNMAALVAKADRNGCFWAVIAQEEFFDQIGWVEAFDSILVQADVKDDGPVTCSMRLGIARPGLLSRSVQLMEKTVSPMCVAKEADGATESRSNLFDPDRTFSFRNGIDTLRFTKSDKEITARGQFTHAGKIPELIDHFIESFPYATLYDNY